MQTLPSQPAKSKAESHATMPANPAAENELGKYNDLYAKKELELREINLRRAKKLEVQLRKREEENASLRDSLESTHRELQFQTEKIAGFESQIREYEARFREVKELMVEKNARIEELQKTVEEQRTISAEEVQRVRVTLRAVQEKCEALQEELKSASWKHDQAIQNLNSENEEYKKKLKLTVEDKEAMLHNQRTQFEAILKKELAEKDAEFAKEKSSLSSLVESRSNENIRLAVERSELEKSNESLRTELTRIRSEIGSQKQALDIQGIDATRKASELQTRLLALEKENEFNIKSRDAVYQELAKKLSQAMIERQTLEVDLKSAKERYALELEGKEGTRKLELEKAGFQYEATIRRLEQGMDQKTKELEQLGTELQESKRRVGELERKLQLEQNNKSLMEERRDDQSSKDTRAISAKLQEKENELQRYADKNSHIAGMLAEKQEELRKCKQHIRELESGTEELQNELFKLKSNRQVEVEDIRTSLQAEYDERTKKLSESARKLQREVVSLRDELKILRQKPEREKPMMIPFLDEPYQISEAEKHSIGSGEPAPAVSPKEYKDNKARIMELETENSDLRAAVEEMRELIGSCPPGSEKKAEKEQEQDENRKLKETVERVQNKLVMMRAERDKLVDISNGLRVELNTLRKHSPIKEAAEKSYKDKLERLKRDYHNLDQIADN